MDDRKPSSPWVPWDAQVQTKHFTLLIFDELDETLATRVLHTRDLTKAIAVADRLVPMHRGAAGYQLWENGVRLYTTFPAASEISPLEFMAIRKARRAANDDET